MQGPHRGVGEREGGGMEKKTGQNTHKILQGVKEGGGTPPGSSSHKQLLLWFEERFLISIDFVVTDLTVNLILTNVLSHNSELLANHLSCSTQN